MKSIVTVSRQTTASLTVEHPDGWGEAQVREAVAVRALDIANAVPFWNADANRTTVESVTLDDEVEVEPGMCCGPAEPVELTDDDLIS